MCAERLSTGLRNWLLGSGSMRDAFSDCTMKIYSGTAPTEADDVTTGNLLVTITKSSGDVSDDERSTYNTWKLALATGGATGETCKIRTTFNSEDSELNTYTVESNDEDEIRLGVVELLNDLGFVRAIPADSGDSEIYVTCRVPGDVVVITDGTGDVTVTPTETDTEARSDTLWFAAPSSGAISKSTDTWSGEVETTGVAGYFRIVRSDDDGTDSSTAIRLQGSVATSGAELNLSNTSLTDGSTLTIDSFSVTLPAE